MKALYAGSFDPFTIGHKDIADRALAIFDELIIAIGINERKKNSETAEIRRKAIEEVFKGNSRVKVVEYKGLTAEEAKKLGAGVLVRGVRNVDDFEKEKELADINLKVLDMPTVLIPADPGLAFVSSSMVRELFGMGFDAQEFIASNCQK